MNVNFPGGSAIVKVWPSWDVARVKREIVERSILRSQDFQIVFAGQTLGDNQTLSVSVATAKGLGHLELVY